MKKIYNQILYHLKKDKSSYISFGIIILLTAFMLNLATTLLFQVDKAYDEKFERLNTASVNAFISKSQDTTDFTNEISKVKGVTKTESSEGILTETVVKDFKNYDFTMNTVFYNLDETRKLNNFEIKEKNDKKIDNPIYIPFYVAEFGEFPIGKEFVYVIDGAPYRFTVAGIIEEMQYGNYGSGLMCAYLPKEEYQTFAQNHKKSAVVEYSLTVDESANLDEVKEDVTKIFESKGVSVLSSLDSKSVKGTRTMVCNLLILILLAFAMIILIVSLFLSNFRVKNSIDSEIVNMSVLKAIGYTGGQIVATITLPYTMVTALFTLLGVGLSYLALPVLSQVLTVQSGFSFDLNFDVPSLLFAVIVLTTIVTVITFTSARKIKKTQPIEGLRGNICSKALRKNYFPLESTKGDTKFLLIMKQIFVCKKQNVLLFLVSFVLTVLIAFSGTLFYNVVVKPENFMSALSEETPDIIITPKTECADEVEEVLKADSSVENILQYITSNVKIEDKNITAFSCEDFSKVANDLCYMGENPKKANEIALGSAFEKNYKIGDAVKVSIGEKEKSYKVTGFVQSVNLQGELCQLSLKGYMSLCDTNKTPSVYVYLKDNTDAENFVKAIENEHSEKIADIVNSQKSQKEAQDMYMGIAVVLVVLIFVITILIVLFILYIVIKSLLVKRKQELGIYKSMGYTSKQLILQTVGSFMPVSALATILSSAVALFYMPCIYQFIFQSIGAVKNNMEISLIFLLIFAVIQIIINVIISVILCMPVKKISAYSLIKE